MSLLKQRISSPLEAGPSILDIHNLPPHLTEALEYTSKRLARKALHITLVVVRKGYQLPSVVPPCPTPTSPPLRPGIASPTRFASPVIGLRQLVRRGTGNSTSSTSSSPSFTPESGPSSSVSSPMFPPPSTEPLTTPHRWVMPLTPASPFPRTPLTPHTPSSIATTTTSSSMCSTAAQQQGPNEFGIRLIHATPLSPKAERTLRDTILKAERKFRVGTGWLPPAASASACGLNADLVRRSLLQNEVLFSSEGLTLLGLDRLYTFKSALAAYGRSVSNSSGIGGASSSLSPAAADSTRVVEDAVDSLRRLVLANGGRPVSRADLHRSYDWLGVSARALRDVESMYRRAYGGPERTGAFETTATAATTTVAREPAVVKIGPPPPPKTPPRTQTTPVLKLNTQLATATAARIFKPKARAVAVGKKDMDMAMDMDRDERGAAAAIPTGQEQKQKTRGVEVTEIEIKIDDEDWVEEEEDYHRDEEDGDRTERPARHGAPSLLWRNVGASSIDELMLSPVCDRQSQQLGPTTPNGYDDISPITRGEWGFLFKGDGWARGRTAAVETW
ncbi:hypothetical protein GGR52DRAFT_222566 [Hypoxylon sp. FL1284]|nr:hypothetical protein GGR52DRAFT_222566 [Hypoxylon sp. FL1284]